MSVVNSFVRVLVPGPVVPFVAGAFLTYRFSRPFALSKADHANSTVCANGHWAAAWESKRGEAQIANESYHGQELSATHRIPPTLGTSRPSSQCIRVATPNPTCNYRSVSELAPDVPQMAGHLLTIVGKPVITWVRLA
jgi:hypothetical protein